MRLLLPAPRCLTAPQITGLPSEERAGHVSSVSETPDGTQDTQDTLGHASLLLPHHAGLFTSRSEPARRRDELFRLLEAGRHAEAEFLH